MITMIIMINLKKRKPIQMDDDNDNYDNNDNNDNHDNNDKPEEAQADPASLEPDGEEKRGEGHEVNNLDMISITNGYYHYRFINI